MAITVPKLKTLSWKEFDSFDTAKRSNYDMLEEKIRKHKWSPAPPIIISPMPEFYNGIFRYFVYHGNNRLELAIKYKVQLKGIVVTSSKEVPENYTVFTPGTTANPEPEEVLRFILTSRLQPHKRIYPYKMYNYELPYLVKEFERYEKKTSLK